MKGKEKGEKGERGSEGERGGEGEREEVDSLSKRGDRKTKSGSLRLQAGWEWAWLVS